MFLSCERRYAFKISIKMSFPLYSSYSKRESRITNPLTWFPYLNLVCKRNEDPIYMVEPSSFGETNVTIPLL